MPSPNKLNVNGSGTADVGAGAVEMLNVVPATLGNLCAGDERCAGLEARVKGCNADHVGPSRQVQVVKP